MKINLISFNPLAADAAGNARKAVEILRAPAPEADLFVFPEAALCGCPLFDLFDDKRLCAQNVAALKEIAKETKNAACVLGYADCQSGQSVTAAAFIYKGRITKIFDTETVSFNGKKLQISLEDPQNTTADPDADAVIFLLARPYQKGNIAPRLEALKKFAKKNIVPALLCNLLGGGDGMIFDGLCAMAGKKGVLLFCSDLFCEKVHLVDLEEKYSPVSYQTPVLQELLDALTFGLRDYVHKSGTDKVVFGVSGGIDSAFTAALAAQALGGESVYCVSLPSYATSALSKTLAGRLAVKLGVNLEEVGVRPVLDSVKEALSHIVSHPKDATAQELQSRLRTVILAALAGEYNAALISTDDKSENAVGSVVLYGDAGGCLQPLGDLYKTEIYELAEYLNKDGELIPRGIIERAPTSELSPNQKDEDFLPPYTVLDKILRGYLEDGLTAEEIVKKFRVKKETVLDVLTRVNRADLKRRQTAPCLQVSPNSCVSMLRPVIKKINL